MVDKVEVDADLLLSLAGELRELRVRMEAVPHNDHNEQHDWLKERIETEKRRKEFWMSMQEKLITRGVFGALTLFGFIIWYAIKEFLKHNG